MYDQIYLRIQRQKTWLPSSEQIQYVLCKERLSYQYDYPSYQGWGWFLNTCRLDVKLSYHTGEQAWMAHIEDSLPMAFIPYNKIERLFSE